MAKNNTKEKDTTATDDVTRVSATYTKDFTVKVKNLQTKFAGKSRRALYDELQEKGVITKDYTVEMWDNDFKSWRKNPNNGIFRHLEMVSAILDVAGMPAFEVFGGPHARDTDEIIKGVSSGIESYLEISLKEIKAFILKKKKAAQRHERIINGNTFKFMKQVYDLIEKHYGPSAKQFSLGMNNSAFFFLYAWTDIDKKMKIEELANCVQLLANMIINSKFASYYFGYFSLQYEGKTFHRFQDPLITPPHYCFDIILNDALIITYQLNYIIQIYNLYYENKKILFTYKPDKKLTYLSTLGNYIQDPSAQAHYIPDTNSDHSTDDLDYDDPYIQALITQNISTQPTNFPDPYLDLPTENGEPRDDIAPFYKISDIDVRTIFSLEVNKLNLEDKQNEPKKILKQKLIEIRERFVNIVNLIDKKDLTSEDQFVLINDAFSKTIAIFQKVICQLYFSQNDPQRSNSYYTITKGKKNFIKSCSEYFVFNITQQMLDSIELVLIGLNNIADSFHEQEKFIEQQNKLQEIDSNEDDGILPPDEESNEELVIPSEEGWEVVRDEEPIKRQNDEKGPHVIRTISSNHEAELRKLRDAQWLKKHSPDANFQD